MKKSMTEKKVEKGNELVESFVLWCNTSKAGNEYLTGILNEELGKGKIIGYFNTMKKNPKEPDIRVYSINEEGKQDKEICDLWENESKAHTRYLTGSSDEKEKLIGFYGEKNLKTPYIRVYFKN